MNDLQNNDLDLIQNLDLDYIIGIDEAGRGPLAGDVFACAVLISKQDILQYQNDKIIDWIKDSKKVTEKRRNQVFKYTKDKFNHKVKSISNKIIDQINILEATKLAWQESLDEILLEIPFDSKVLILIDGNIGLENDFYPIKPIVKGDSKHFCIALASIIAKVTRDNYMIMQDKDYPEYDFAKHKGYGTELHRVKIKELGLSSIHRKTFCKKLE